MKRIALTAEDLEDLLAGASINVPAEDGNEEFLLVPDGRSDQVQSILKIADAILQVHENVQMDTPEDKELHARACAQFRMALETAGKGLT